jgi:NTP pyrophosphatase (non-canonical NTP hydrolase)
MIRKFDSMQEECLVILMEECGELIQECTKMIRKNSYSSDLFCKEVGDVIAMLQLASKYGLYKEDRAIEHASAKIEKLKKWSNLVN